MEISYRVEQFPNSYEEILKIWGIILYAPPSLPSIIATQILWYNKYVKIDNKTFHKSKIVRK